MTSLEKVPNVTGRKVYVNFNRQYASTLNRFANAFNDVDELTTETALIGQMDVTDDAIHNRFSREVSSDDVSDVLDENPSVLENCVFFTRLGFNKIFKRLDASEVKDFWMNFKVIAKQSSLIRGAGNHLGAIEEISDIFVKHHGDKIKTDPLGTILSTLKGDGPGASQIKSIISKPDLLKGCLDNMKGTLYNLNEDGGGRVMNDISRLMRNTNLKDGDGNMDGSIIDEEAITEAMSFMGSNPDMVSNVNSSISSASSKTR